ncbi:MAG: hypothetical protein JW860_15985 [Sedimentisphaerales bacterium]|nr:hypothetical protein [Sedimentisphaerales bacterium]
MMMVSKKLMDILVCPRCKGPVRHENMFLLCNQCRLAYPLLDINMPNMIIDNAWSLDQARTQDFIHYEQIE